MPRPVDGDEGGRMEIEIYLPMQSITPALWAGLLTAYCSLLTVTCVKSLLKNSTISRLLVSFSTVC